MRLGGSMVRRASLQSRRVISKVKIALVRSRYFTAAGAESSKRVILIDENLARRFWSNRDPIGRPGLWPLDDTGRSIFAFEPIS